MKKILLLSVMMLGVSLVRAQMPMGQRPAVAASQSVSNENGSAGGLGFIFGTTYMTGRKFYTGDYSTQVYPTTYIQKFSPTFGLEGWGESHMNKFILGGGGKVYYACMKYDVAFGTDGPYNTRTDLFVLDANGYLGCQIVDPLAITLGLSIDNTWEGVQGSFTSPRQDLGCFLAFRVMPVEHFYISLSANYGLLKFKWGSYRYYYVGGAQYSCDTRREHPLSLQLGLGYQF